MLIYRALRFLVSCLLLIFDMVIILYVITYVYFPDSLHHSPIIDWFIHGFVTAIDSLINDGTEELRRLQRMYQRGWCDDQYFDAEKKRIDDQRTALDREREKAQRLLDRNKNAIAQLAELEEIGKELRSSLLGITEERKRRIYQRLRLHVTAEFTESGQGNSGSNRHIVIEVLGFSERVSIRNTSAPSRVFDTSLRDPLMFRVPLSHPQ